MKYEEKKNLSKRRWPILVLHLFNRPYNEANGEGSSAFGKRLIAFAADVSRRIYLSNEPKVKTQRPRLCSSCPS